MSEFDDVIGRLVDQVMAEVDRRVTAAEQAEYDDWNARIEENLSKEVRDLQERRDALEAKVADLEKGVSEYPDVAFLVAMVSGEITHVVEEIYGSVKVMTFDEWMLGRGDTRSVVVYPVKYRDGVQYGLKYEGAQYGDGSGTKTPLTFCRSEEEAHHVVLARFYRAVDLWAGKVPPSGREVVPTSDSRIWKSYAETGVALPWPEELLTAINDTLRAEAEAKIVQARTHLNSQLHEQRYLKTFAPLMLEGVS